MFHMATPAMQAIQLKFLSATLSETAWMCSHCRSLNEPAETSCVPARSYDGALSTLCSRGCLPTLRVIITLPRLCPQGMYLDPLAEIVAANGGLVYNASRYARLCDAVTMMVDVKQGGGAMDPNSSFVVLHAILSEYQGALLATNLSQSPHTPLTSVYSDAVPW